MKELSIEQKAKRYDEALERAKKWFNSEEPDSYTCIVESIFPELYEIEDEKIKKVYRVENEAEQKGLWRKFDGTYQPLFDMLTDGQCKDLPMEDSPIYREGGKRWFASAPSKETLQKWFSKKDLEELVSKGFTISEFEVVGYKKVSDFEYIFTRDNIINRNYLEVSDIYSEQKDYIEIKTLGELEKYKNRVLLFGYWDKDFPAYAWACKFISAIASFDENKHNPDTPIDKITVKAYHNIVVMYDGNIDVSFYPDMTHPLLEPRKVNDNYNSDETTFDGQLFIRTLTSDEYKVYRKTMKNKAR